MIRFGGARITLAIDEDTASGLPAVSHRTAELADRPTPAELSTLITDMLHEAVPRRLTVVEPVGWDDGHRTAMTRAAAAAGVARPACLIGPVAVAHSVATGLRWRRSAAVVTLCGPVAEVAVLTRTRTGFRVRGEPSGIRVADTAQGRGRVVEELLAVLGRAGLSAERLAGVYLVGDTEPVTPLAAEIRRTLGTTTTARRDLDAAAVHGALSAYPDRKRPTRLTAAVLALMVLAGLAGARLGGGTEPAGARFVAAPLARPPLAHLLDDRAGTFATLDTATGVTAAATRIPPHASTWHQLTPDARTVVAGSYQGLLLIDTATGRVRHRVGLKGTTGTVVSPDSRTVYALRRDRSEIVGVDTASGAGRPPMTVGPRAARMLVSPDGATIYALETAEMFVDSDDTRSVRAQARLHIVDTGTGRGRRLALHHTIRQIALTPDGRTLFVAAGKWLGPLDTTTGERRPAVALPGEITTLTVTPDGRSVYALCEKPTRNGPVTVAAAVDAAATTDATTDAATDAATGVLRAEIALPGLSGSSRLSAAPDGRRVYVSGSGNPAIGWIDTVTDTAAAPLAVGGPPRAIVHSPDGSAAYVPAGTALVTVDPVAGRTGRSFPLPSDAVTVATPG